MQYSSLPTAFLLSLLAAGTQAIPTTNGAQAQAPRNLLPILPKDVSQAPQKRGYPLQPNPPNDLYSEYDCGGPYGGLDPQETEDAKRALEVQVNRGDLIPEYGCLTGTCGGTIAFYCAATGHNDGTTQAPPGDLPKIWNAVAHECGENQVSLVGFQDGNSPSWAAGLLPVGQEYRLRSILSMLVGKRSV